MRAPAPEPVTHSLSVRGRTATGRHRARALGILLVLPLCVPAFGTDLFVNSGCGSDAYDGLSMEVGGGHGPKLTIQAAIGAAANGDAVTVAQGTYYECINFNGKQITVQSTDPDDSTVVQNTVIDGGGDWEFPATVVTFANAETNSSTLTGFTITSSEGLGVSCTNSSSPTISKNRITSNVGMAGGGISCIGSSPIISGNAISYNSGMSRGGIYCTSGASPTIIDNTISENSAENGGGIYCTQSSPTLCNNVIAKNSASNCGAGIYLSESSPSIANCTIAGNTIPDDWGGQYGAGLYAYFGSPTVKDSILWGNTKAGFSDQIYNDCSSLTVSYTDVENGWAGTGNINADPQFADATNADYHLKSTGGRWLPGTGWTTDAGNSPGIDAGDPASGYGNEPAPNGGCVNMGAYGNTVEASKTEGAGPQITVSTQSVTVPEGDTATFTVELSAQPGGDVTVSVSIESGDSDIAVQSGASLVFTTGNWDTPQTVTLAAAEDNADADNGSAVVRVSAPDMDNVDVTATEQDNDKSLTVTDGTPAGTTVHQTAAVVDIAATPVDHYHFTEWTGDTTDVTDLYTADTTITMNADAAIAAAAAIDQHTVTTNAVNGTVSGGGTYDYGANAQLQATADGGYHFFNWTDDVPQGQEADNPLSLTVNGDLTLTANFEEDPPELDVSTAALSVPEGGTNTLTIQLTSAPDAAVDVTVAMVGGGDADITVQSGALLTFTPMDWDTPQTVTIAAAEDDTDADNGTATVRVSAANMTDVDVAATESDNDFTLTVAAGSNGSASPEGSSVHTAAQVVNLTATPDQDCEFDAWTGDTANIADPGAASTTITMDADASITATFVAPAPTYYVDATIGNDGYTGLAPAYDGVDGPKLTISAAITAAVTGSTVSVAQGTYNEPINFGGKAITVTGTDPDDPAVVTATVINGGGDYGMPATAVIFSSGEGNDSLLAGLTVTTNVGLGISCTNSSSPTISRNRIVNNSGAMGTGGGIYCYQGSPVIVGNTVSNNSGEGQGAISCAYGTPEIRNNIIAENSSGMGGGAGGILLSNASPLIVNNTIVDNDGGEGMGGGNGGGIYVSSGDPVIRNCVLWGNTVSGGMTANQVTIDSGQTTVEYCAVQDGQSGISGTVTWGSGNISGDPLFVDAANDDYHLQSSSPCIGAGTLTGAPSDDIDGDARPIPAGDTAVDMGADEAASTVDPVDIVLSNDTVAENASGASVGTLSVTGGPQGETYTYTVLTDPSSSFETNGDTLKLVDGTALDFETQASYDITVRAEDTATNTTDEVFTITVTDANDAPEITEGSTTGVTMDEDGAPAAFSLTLNATDQDGDTITWSVSSQATNGTDDASGTGTSKAIGYTPNADWNGADSFGISIDDGNGGTDTITVNVTVSPRNDAPVNTVVPAVTGTAHAGEMLTAGTGTWNDNTDLAPGTLTTTHQWQRADDDQGTNAADIAGATAATYTLQAADNAKYVRVKVTATDDGEGTPAAQSSDAFSAWSLIANAAPVITEGETANVTMDEDGDPTAFTLTLNATDADGDTLTWSISSPAANGTADATGTGASKAIAYTPDADWNDADSFEVTVDDGLGGTDTITVNVTVDPQPDDPTIAGTPDTSVDEDSAYSFVPTADDPDTGDTLAFSIQNQPSWASFSTTTGELSGTPLNDDVGITADIVITVTDSTARSADLAAFDLTVVNTNDAPTVANAIPDQPATEDAPFSFTFAADTFADVDAGDTLTYSATQSDDSPLPSWLTFTPATRTFSGTPLNGDVGTLNVKVTATDSTSAAVSDLFDITVANTNDAPEITEGTSVPVTMDEDGDPAAFALTLNATDQDGDTIAWSVSSQATNGTASATDTGTSKAIGYTPTADWNGADSFEVSIDDGNGGTDSITVNVTVNARNDAPVNTVVPAVTGTAHAGEFLTADNGTWNDDIDLTPGTLGYAYQWQRATDDQGTNAADIAAATASTYTLNADDGNKWVRCTVTATDDGEGLPAAQSASASSAWLHVDNNAPVITEGASTNVTMDEDGDPTAFSLTLNATDADGDTLTWSVSSPAANGTADASGTGASKAITYTPDADWNGADSFEVTVDDNAGDTASITVNVTVDPQPDAPTIAGSPATSVDEDSAYSFVPAADDPDTGDTLTFSIQSQPSWASFSTTTGELSGTPVNDDVGTTTGIVITVTDSTARTAELAAFDLAVVNTNDAPTVANAIPDQPATEDAAFSFAFAADTFADVDLGDTLTYSATQADDSPLPAWITFDAPTRVFSGTPLNDDVGTLNVKVTATDSGDATAADLFDITVANTNDAPEIAEGTSVPVTMDEDGDPATFSLTLNAIDVDGDTITWSVSSQATNGTASATGPGASKAIGYTPTADWHGADSFDVSIDDGNGGTDTITVNVTVDARNDAPANTVVPVVTGTGHVGDELSTDTGTWNDATDLTPGTLTYTYQWQRADDDQGTDTEDIADATNSTYTPVTDDNGQWVRARVTATDDGEGTPATQSTDATSTWLSVLNVDPAITEGETAAVTMDEDGAPTAFTLTLNAADTDGDTLTWSVSSLAANGTANASGTGTSKAITYTPDANWNGADSFDVTVDDGVGGTDTLTVSVTVNAQPDAPTIAGTPVTVADEDAVYSFTPTADDPDAGETLTFGIQNQPAWASFSTTTGELSGTPVNDDVGTTVGIAITVTDSTDRTADLTAFDLTVVNTNDAPTLANPIADQPATEDALFSFTFPADTFADVDVDDTFTYSATRADDSPLPGWLSLDGPTRTFSGTPLNADVGILSVKLTATDSGAATASDVFDITVANINDAPEIAEGTSVPVTMDEDAAPTAFSLTLNATDVDGDTITWSVSSQAGHGTADASGTGTSKAIGYTPNANWNGADSFDITVDDGNGGTDTVTVDVTVDPRNDAPVNTIAPAITGLQNVGQPLTTDTGTWDDNTDLTPGAITHTYQWQRADDDQGTNAANVNYATSATYQLTTDDDAHWVRCVVTATDNGEGSPSTASAEAASAWAEVTNPPRNYYIDATTGNDYYYDGWAETYDGTHGPKRTIQAAIDVCSDGSTVIVAEGLYNEGIDFLGKAITVRSADPDDPEVVADTILWGENLADCLVVFHADEGNDSVLAGFTMAGSGSGAVDCMGSSPTVEKNVITGNDTSPAVRCTASAPLIRRNVITDNCSPWGTIGIGGGSNPLIANNLIVSNRSGMSTSGIVCIDSSATIVNCTIARNLSVFTYFAYEQAGGVSVAGGNGIALVDCPDVQISNCIIRDNWGALDTQIALHSSQLAMDHTNIEASHRGITRTQSVLTWGQGNRDMDPRFVDPANGDYHLRSIYGRWDPDTATWVTDLRHSPGIDGGNPADDHSQETTPNGGRVNMGAYGNTVYASHGVQFSDSDGDRLVGYFEATVLGTNPLSADTDADGMPDGWEYAHGLDPLADDAADDLDFDGLTNAAEYSGGTAPDHYDSDGDGLGDGWEEANGLDSTSGADEALVAYWRCDDESGGALRDDCTNAYADTLIHDCHCRHTGTAPNGCTWDWGGINGCLSLNGIDQYASAAEGPNLDLTGDATLALWLKFSSFACPDDPVYAFIKENDAGVIEFALRYTKTTGALELLHTNASAGSETASESCDLAAGTWYHLAATISSSSVQFYLDGAGLGSAHQLSYSRSSAGDIFLGRSLYDASSSPLHGCLDEIRLYGAALSAQDIADLISERDADTDGDGLTNEIEFLFGTDIAVDDSVADDDGDGLTNADEIMIHGTDHTNADSDGDGMNDGDEINGTTDALLADQGSDAGGPVVTLTYPATDQTIGF